MPIAVNMDASIYVLNHTVSLTCTAAKGKQTRRRKAADEPRDIAVPSLDEDGNLLDQPAAEEEDDDASDSENEDDDGEDSDFQGGRARSNVRRGAARGRGARGNAGGAGRSAGARASTSTTKGAPRKRKIIREGEEGAMDTERVADGAEAARGKDDFSVEADNNLFSK